MRHFEMLGDPERARLFHRPPEAFDADSPVALLGQALGATLYSPATRPELVADLLHGRRRGLVSSVVCLEDAIPDHAVPDAELRVVRMLRELTGRDAEVPLVFVRARTPEQVGTIAAALRGAQVPLHGFVLPKFSSVTGPAWLQAVARASESLGRDLWAMPVLEGPLVMHRETRFEELQILRELLAMHRAQVLAVRLGVTDLAGLYGLRHPRDLTIHDVRVVADLIADVVNVFGRADGTGFAVTGPVWEYFGGQERVLRPQLRLTPFQSEPDREMRAGFMAGNLDGLIREVVLDRANGLAGKTVIHPSHVALVHALSVVPHEEYVDAASVLAASATGGGAVASVYGNKMNEASPHRAWAERTSIRAQVFGVAAPDVTFVDLLAASVHA